MPTVHFTSVIGDNERDLRQAVSWHAPQHSKSESSHRGNRSSSVKARSSLHRGSTANSIRGVMQAAAVKDKLNVNVEFLD